MSVWAWSKLVGVVRLTVSETVDRKHSPRWTVCDGDADLIALLRGDRPGRWQPGVPEHELVQDVVGAEAVLAGGVDVAADVEPVLGDVVAGEAARDLLLCFQGADAAL